MLMKLEEKFNLNTAILLLVLLALVAGATLVITSIRQVTRPLAEAERTLRRQVEQITNPTPTIIPDPVTIVREVRNLSRLETASYTVEKVITAETNQGPFAFLFGDKLILVAHGQVIAGVDLAKVEDSDVAVTAEGTVEVTLPPAEVFVTALNNEQSYVFHRDTGVIGMNPDLETEARQAAEEEIRKAALEDGILEMAQQNAETYIRHLILTLGFEKVEIVVQE
jgi:hypothetical protein